MAGFLYYLPSDGPKTRSELEDVGFPHADSIELPGCGCTQAPDGLHGAVTKLRDMLVIGGQSPVVGYYPEKQTWCQILDGRMWLGWETENPPTPIDLQRKELHNGHPVTLADGNTWIVPVIRTLIGQTTLPTVFGCNASGQVVREKVLPAFKRLWDLTQRLYKAVQGFDESLISGEETIELLCSGLAMNYRVSFWEVMNLGILTTENKQLVFGAMIDFPAAAIAGEE